MNTSAAKTDASKRKRPRTCVGCFEESPKRVLLRVVRSPDGAVDYDPSGRASGRGAYVCCRIECIQAARKKNAFARTLKVPVGAELYVRLEELCK